MSFPIESGVARVQVSIRRYVRLLSNTHPPCLSAGVGARWWSLPVEL